MIWGFCATFILGARCSCSRMRVMKLTSAKNLWPNNRRSAHGLFARKVRLASEVRRRFVVCSHSFPIQDLRGDRHGGIQCKLRVWLEILVVGILTISLKWMFEWFCSVYFFALRTGDFSKPYASEMMPRGLSFFPGPTRSGLPENHHFDLFWGFSQGDNGVNVSKTVIKLDFIHSYDALS